MNPVTGNVVKVNGTNNQVTLTGPDGLTYDASTGFLFTANTDGNNKTCIMELDPLNLPGSNTGCFAAIPNPSSGDTNQLDGITSDGHGSVFVVTRPNSISYPSGAGHVAEVYQVVEASPGIPMIVSTDIFGLDDITLAQSPEPEAFLLAAFGLTGVMLLGRAKKILPSDPTHRLTPVSVPLLRLGAVPATGRHNTGSYPIVILPSFGSYRLCYLVF